MDPTSHHRPRSVRSVKNDDVESRNEKDEAAAIQQAREHHMNVGLTEDDTAFLESFTDEQKTKVLRKVSLWRVLARHAMVSVPQSPGVQRD